MIIMNSEIHNYETKLIKLLKFVHGKGKYVGYFLF